MRRLRSARTGFTLAEMMVVIVIIGLLATLVVPSVLHRFERAQRVKALSDVQALLHAATEYALDNGGRHPETLEALVTPNQNGHSFLEGCGGRIPRDPWKNEYQYEPPRTGHPLPRILSYASDGAPGGEGSAADIASDLVEN